MGKVKVTDEQIKSEIVKQVKDHYSFVKSRLEDEIVMGFAIKGVKSLLGYWDDDIENAVSRVSEWLFVDSGYCWVDSEGNIFVVGYACHNDFCRHCLGTSDIENEKKMARVSGAYDYGYSSVKEDAKRATYYVEEPYLTPKMRIALKKHLRAKFYSEEKV